jgi:hypothetical protein
LLTDLGSSNFGSIHVEGVASSVVFELTEALIGRILGEGAFSPHRGNRRRMPRRPVSIELLKLMLFILSMMRMRMRRVRMLRRLLDDHLLSLLVDDRGARLLGRLLLLLMSSGGLIFEHFVETGFVPDEGIVDGCCLSEHHKWCTVFRFE